MIPSIPVITGALHANQWECHCQGDWKHLEAGITQQHISQPYLGRIKHWQMNVYSHGAAAVFVVGICRITQRWWRKRTTGRCISHISNGLHVITDASQGCTSPSLLTYLGTFSHANVHSHQLCLWPQHQTEWAIRDKSGRSIQYQFFCIIMDFSHPLHIFSSPLLFPPPYLSMNSPRQKDKLPSGLLF